MNKHCAYSFQFMIDYLQKDLDELYGHLKTLDNDLHLCTCMENEERVKNDSVLLQREEHITKRINEQTQFHSWDVAIYHGVSEALSQRKQSLSNTLHLLEIKRQHLLKQKTQLQKNINNNIKQLRKFEAHKQIMYDNHSNHQKRVESKKEEESMFLYEACKSRP